MELERIPFAQTDESGFYCGHSAKNRSAELNVADKRCFAESRIARAHAQKSYGLVFDVVGAFADAPFGIRNAFAGRLAVAIGL
jgi:hypothetical protein